VWTSIRSVEELRELRTSSMDTFLNDFGAGKRQGRYVVAELPTLPFRGAAFPPRPSARISSFSIQNKLSEDFHVSAALEMCRVADEVRIFSAGCARSRTIRPRRSRHRTASPGRP